MADEPVQPNPGDGSFVDRIVTDPNNVPDVMLLYGYSGASSEEGYERLYFSADLATYVEIPVDAILHRAAAPRERDPNGGVTLWVRKDAALIHKMAPGAQVLAHFFAGAIQAQGAAPAAPLPGAPALTVGGPACGVTLPAICQFATAACTRNTCGIACTHPVLCHVATAACTQNTCGIACTHPALCQVATAACTRDTCGVVCTAAGPCLTRGPECPTQAATCACTEIGCPTDITPCVNTHAATCGPCPSVIAVCQTAAGCQSAGADCTFIGCGHTLACTQGLLCAAPPQARAAGAAALAPLPVSPFCGQTQPGVCPVGETQPGVCPVGDTRPGVCPVVVDTIVCTRHGAGCNNIPGLTVVPLFSCYVQCTPFCPDFTPRWGGSLVCLPVSLACGVGQPGPVAPGAQMRMAVPTQVFNCSQVCSQLPQMGCGHGCALNTVM